jgi:formate dehydrogenase iron-sulfur subunit
MGSAARCTRSPSSRSPGGVGGTHVLYVLAQADHPEQYGLPRDPQIPWTVSLWKGPVKWLGNALLLGGIFGTILHYLRYGPQQTREIQDDAE